MTSRDFEILDFLEKYSVCTTSLLAHKFFNDKKAYCYKRLQYLTDKGYVKTVKISGKAINSENVFYLKNPPKNIKHQLGIVWFVIKFMDHYNVLDVKLETKIENIIPDIILTYKNERNDIKIMLCEVQRRHENFNYMKYENLYASQKFKKYFNEFPEVALISNSGYLPENSRIIYKKYAFNEDYKP